MANNKKRLSAWLNLRSLVLVLALFLLFAPSKPAIFNSLDQALFSLGLNLVAPQAPEVDVAVITLSEQEYAFLREDWGQARDIGKLLNQLSGDRSRAVGLVFDQAPRLITSPADNLMEKLGRSDNLSPEEKQQVNSFVQSRLQMSAALTKPQVVSGLLSAREDVWHNERAPLTYIPIEESGASDLLSWLPSWLRPQIPHINLRLNDGDSNQEVIIENEALESEFRLSPLMVENSLLKTLIVSSADGVHAEFLLRLLAQRGQIKGTTWIANDSIRLDSIRLPTSANGSVVPYYTQRDEALDLISRQSLAEALQSLPEQSLVLVGLESSPLLNDSALALLSLDNQHYFYSPYWLSWLQITSIILVLSYLVVLQPKMGHASAIFASCLLLFIFVVAQLGWQITQWQYLPLGIAIQFLLAGHVLMMLWKVQRDNLNQLQAAAHGARYQLGLQLFRDGRADDALLAVKECFSSEAVLNLIYDIAAQQERKRQYGEAVKTYKELTRRQPSFRDVTEKVEKLIAFSSSSGTASFGGDSSIAKTLIVSESSISKPVLGRYEIERELGRGAMGVVYLGRDPKIARQVAIKTLSYNNIGGKELDEFKERFFREAEAAGRLNHPNIVTIYDVGEEHDLAFIAMDYVEGQSLGAYSSEEDLLPVEKVFKIVVDVAEALNYAHGKNVVHRDIKPSNIMYEPESGKVKVTDFGVARIIDSSRTQTGDVLGSPLYMSPEQLKGSKVTEHTDIYSLGVTFYQLLSGKLPHSGDSLANLTYNIIHEKHTGVRELRPDLPKNLTRIINKAMHKDPSKRYSNAKDFAAAVKKILEEDLVVED